jgi:hypothetical protein
MVNDTTGRQMWLLRAQTDARIFNGELLIIALLFALTVLYGWFGAVWFYASGVGYRPRSGRLIREHIPVHMAGLAHWIVITGAEPRPLLIVSAAATALNTYISRVTTSTGKRKQNGLDAGWHHRPLSSM